ncbi:MAG: hypothetical protein HF978_15370 [Desulfobacteraceae bacterium]|nr:hypothetical protein [Desulfobacteraceae bacterium]MBC2756921.1 hypothetical protein [Desulfobacteraceae bacterium]
MSKRFRPSNLGESKIISKIVSSKEYERRKSINAVAEKPEELSNYIAMKLVESDLVETTNKNSMEEQITLCLEKLIHADDFDIDYQIAPIRNIVSNPNIISIYVTSFVIEKLINHKDTVDIYGSDEEIYACIHKQVEKFLSK